MGSAPFGFKRVDNHFERFSDTESGTEVLRIRWQKRG
jgi:hypothetical protein